MRKPGLERGAGMATGADQASRLTKKDPTVEAAGLAVTR
jgi:hypothetical protein